MTAALKRRESIGVANTATPTIAVWFHVIRTGLSIPQGDIPDSWIYAQLNVLNGAFIGRFSFQLAGITRTTNSGWWNLIPNSAGGAPEMQMKQALRRGTAATLNFYTSQVGRDAQGFQYLGWATFPGGMCGVPSSEHLDRQLGHHQPTCCTGDTTGTRAVSPANCCANWGAQPFNPVSHNSGVCKG